MTIVTKTQFNPGQEQDRIALEQEQGQYSLWQILGIVALVALPMGSWPG